MDLNPEQREAVKHRDGPMLILAGAGSGKTRVIVNRIAYLIEQGVNPEHILAVSFTNRAVREMEERVADMVNNRKVAKKLTLSTFHSLGVRILRTDIDLLNYPRQFTIYDPSDQLALIKRVMREKRIDEKRFDPKYFQAEIAKAKNEGQEPKDIRDIMLREIFLAYDDALRTCGAVDFDDLIRLPCLLLKNHDSVRQRWSGRFRQIMIDEYQDTNGVQLQMVRELASIHGNLCVVGDDDQSIYGWRGSDVENIRQFDKHFPGTRVVKLTQNYRCSGNILDAANKVIEQGVGRYHKRLWTEQDNGALVGMAVLADEEGEARFVVDHLQTTHFEEKRKWSEFSIMYRTNAQSRALEELLRNERIPYKMIGGTKFFDRKEIRDLIAYLKVVNQPKDEISLRRIINYPPRGIGTATIDKLSAFAKQRRSTLYDACLHIDDCSTVGKAQRNAINDFTEMIENLKGKVEEGRSLALIAEMLISAVKFQHALFKEYSEVKEAKKRVDNVDALVNSMIQYEGKADKPSLSDYLDRVSLEPSGDNSEEEDEDAVMLITLHGAKGLEYPIVYLVGMEEGFLPYFRIYESDTDIEEERRLCYVGITRAKQKLILSRALQRRRFGRMEDREPSRFLADIPPKLLHPMGIGGKKPAVTEEERDEKFKSFFSEVFGMLEKD